MSRDIHPRWRPAQVLDNRPVANGSMWITLEAVDALPAAYEPGHVLGLGLKFDESYMRHAYTVSRGEPRSGRFEHLYRIISTGRMTPRLAMLSPGATLYFHGPFHSPIQQEIHPDAERIVLIATGTGVGPLFGYAEKALREGEARPMTLYAGFHEESDICLAPELDLLAQRYSHFDWHCTVTHPSNAWRNRTGRVTKWIPDEIRKHKLAIHHFHLVGNGEMVHLVRNALLRAGLPAGRVSIETYFNHHVQPPDAEVENLTERLEAAGSRRD